MKGLPILFPLLPLLVLILAEIRPQYDPVARLTATRSTVEGRGQSTPSDPQAVPLRLTRRIPLEGVVKRIDHLTANSDGQQLFIAALGNNSLEVVDLKGGKRIQSLTGLQEPQGLAFVPELNRLFAANGASGDCVLFEAASMQRIQRIKLGEDADNVRYDSAAKRIYVGYGAGALAILDTKNGEKLGEIKLAGHPESFQLEKNGSRVFVNVPTAGHIAVVDRLRRTVTATWPLEGVGSNFPMGLDEASHRLFVGCRKPAKLLIYDTSAGREIGRFPIGGDTDDLFWDAKQKQLYVICGAGVISSFRERNPGRFEPMAEIATVPGARTGLFVAETGCLYVAVPQRGPRSAEILEYSVQEAQ